MPQGDPLRASYQPELADGGVLGSRCTVCARPVAPATPRCPACGGAMAGERFAGRGTVWSATRIHIAVGEVEPPYALAYLDLDDGPRVLVRQRETVPAPIGSRGRLEPSDLPEVWAELVEEVDR